MMGKNSRFICTSRPKVHIHTAIFELLIPLSLSVYTNIEGDFASGDLDNIHI